MDPGLAVALIAIVAVLILGGGVGLLIVIAALSAADHGDGYDPEADGVGSWRLGIAVWREADIRKGLRAPRLGHPREMRWAAEGWPAERAPDDHSWLDTVREGTP